MAAEQRGLILVVMCLLIVLGSTAAKAAGNDSHRVAGGATMAPISITRRSNGLVMSVDISPGPYFVSELISVQVTLSNQSPKAIWYQGVTTANIRTPSEGRTAFFLHFSGGSPPHFVMSPFLQNGGGQVGLTKLPPGTTIHMIFFAPLPSSGSPALVAQAHLYDRGPGIGNYFPPPMQVFAAGWPSLPLTVSSRVPTNRALRLHAAATHVDVIVPHGSLPQLLYQQTSRCGNLQTGTSDWTAVPSSGVSLSDCPYAASTAQVIVSALGYASIMKSTKKAG